LFILPAVLSRNQRLRRTSDFKAVYTRGRSYVHPALVVHVLKVDGQDARIGYSVSKKLGGAVTRNRIKRRLRAACAPLLPSLDRGTDTVIVARMKCLELKTAELASILRAQFERAGIIGS
jgi:ribonuclease P protein component